MKDWIWSTFFAVVLIAMFLLALEWWTYSG